MFKIAGHTMGTPEYTLEEAIHLFRTIGLDGAEVIVQDGYRCALSTDTSNADLEALRIVSEQEKIPIIGLTPYNSKFNDLDDTVRESEIEAIRKVIGYAEVLGSKYIRIYGGNFASGESDSTGVKRRHLVESMRYLGDIAESVGVKLVIENHFNTMTVSASDSISVSKEINHPAVGILYDQANLTFTEKEDWQTALQLQFAKVYYTHVKDLIFREGNKGFISEEVSHPKEEDRNVTTKIVGEGIVPWKEILREMKSRGYEGWLSLEYERRWHPEDIPDASIGMKQSAEYLRNLLTKL